MGRSAKPVVYKGDTFDSLAELAAAFDMSPGTCRARLKKGIPLDSPWGRGGCKQEKPAAPEPEAAEPASEPEPKPDNTEAVRQAVTALPLKSNRYADEGNGRRLRDCPCELDGRQYSSLDTAAVILDLTLGEAYRQVMERGKFLKKGAK